MRLKDPWFELLTFITAVFWAACAIITIVNHVRGGFQDFLPTVLSVAASLFLALLFFRASCHLGKLQKKARPVSDSSSATIIRDLASGNPEAEKRVQEIFDRVRERLIATRQTIQESEPVVSEQNLDIADEGGEQLNYLRNHPPRCIAGFKVRPVTMRGVVFDGHASPSQLNSDASGVKIEGAEHTNPVFWLVCTCGHDTHFILGHYWRNPDYHNVPVFVSPLALRCSDCGKVTEIIDTDIHGYDAEIGAIPTNYRGEGERAEFACDMCGPSEFQAFARFEYSSDLFERKSDKFRGREQDLFSWFSLVGKCAGCGRLLSVADFECA